MTNNTNGLSSDDVKKLQLEYGKNTLTKEKKQSFINKALHIICEPMFLLLLIAAVIYFVLGEPRDGAIMLIFVIGIISIDIIQEWKTDKTLNALKDLSAPHITVRRDGAERTIASEDLVPGDIMMICEGVKIPADGFIMRSSDLCCDESSLTGEAEGVWKTNFDKNKKVEDTWRKDYCYAGTLVTQGTAEILVDKIGSKTEYGKIGEHVASAPDFPTPLQKQTRSLVKLCAIIAAVLFILVCLFTYLNLTNHAFKDRIVESILSGITLAMAMIPEEFPVIFTVFLSLGAWRLAKKHSLVRRLPSVETLGAISVLCVDKTGTITENRMTVTEALPLDCEKENLLETMGLACETEAYDPMEKAMLTYCEQNGIQKEKLFSGKLLKEYAFTNELKMMGHVWKRGEKTIIAAKGSPERILTICNIADSDRKIAEEKAKAFAAVGLRVIAVAKSEVCGEIPENLTDCRLTLLGLIGLVDPPRKSVAGDIAVCNKAGIRVVMITGDNGLTASAISKQVGIKGSSNIITGDMLNSMSDEELREKVKTVSIFSRVVPEHKMRIVKAFRENGEIVAMTGDGVNDAPALRYADIGISMGKRGSEVSREASDLILMDDNFTTIVETVRDGRRIYDNIRKAIGYVFTIHIPIAFAALLAPFLRIAPAAVLLLPIHVVLLELLIDPTCSIVLERQPEETDIMDRPPRNPKSKLLDGKLLMKSILQGIVVFLASFGTYFYMLHTNVENASIARTMGLAIIMLANIFLVQVNSSNRDFAFVSVKRLIKDKIMWAVNILTIVALIVIIYSPLNSFLKLAPLSLFELLAVILIAAVSVFWIEITKIFKKD